MYCRAFAEEGFCGYAGKCMLPHVYPNEKKQPFRSIDQQLSFDELLKNTKFSKVTDSIVCLIENSPTFEKEGSLMYILSEKFSSNLAKMA